MPLNLPYRGESPQKKITRHVFWEHVRKALGAKRFLQGRYLVLASREAGDVSVLLGLGIPITNIVAVDWDLPEAAGARIKFPRLKVHQGDVVDVVQDYPSGYFTAAFLDFCAPTTEEYLNRVATICRGHIARGGMLGCGFLVGREKTTRESVLLLRDHFIKVTGQRGRRSGRAGLQARGVLIERELRRRSAPRKLQPLSYLYYQSRTKKKRGHPLCVYLARVDPSTRTQKPTPQIRFFDYEELSLREYAQNLAARSARADMLLNLNRPSLLRLLR